MASLGQHLSLFVFGHGMALVVDAHGQHLLRVPFRLLLLLLALGLGLFVLQPGLFFVFGQKDGSSSFRGHFVRLVLSVLVEYVGYV